MGLLSRIRYVGRNVVQMFPPKPTFSTSQIPDLTGHIALVTGGNTGIGKETVKALLEHNATVYLAARSKERAEAAIADLKTVTGREAIFLELDLASLASVRQAAKDFLSKEKELHMLFNNAGVMWCPIELVTKDGFDMQWGTNVVGHFLLTELLVPALAAGARTSRDNYARIVTTSSSTAYLAPPMRYDTFVDGPARRRRGRRALYYQSKLGNAMVAHEAAKRSADKGILSFSCDPGNLRTELLRHTTALEWFFLKHILHPAPMGALTQLWAATMPEAVKHNGEFLIPWVRVGRCQDVVYDGAETERLWRWLETVVDEAPTK